MEAPAGCERSDELSDELKVDVQYGIASLQLSFAPAV